MPYEAYKARKRAYLKRYREPHKEHIKQLQRDWYARNRREIALRRSEKRYAAKSKE